MKKSAGSTGGHFDAFSENLDLPLPPSTQQISETQQQFAIGIHSVQSSSTGPLQVAGNHDMFSRSSSSGHNNNAASFASSLGNDQDGSITNRWSGIAESLDVKPNPLLSSAAPKEGFELSSNFDAIEPTPIAPSGIQINVQAHNNAMAYIPRHHCNEIVDIFRQSNGDEVSAIPESARGNIHAPTVGPAQVPSAMSTDSLSDTNVSPGTNDQNKRGCNQWDLRFRNLLSFHAQFGHFRVPEGWPRDPTLHLWVKRQRVQHRRFRKDLYSTLTEERIRSLEQVGFVWDVHNTAWKTRFDELARYREIHGHCNVSGVADDAGLATWIKYQRLNYRNHKNGQKTNLTPSRIAMLESIGLEWYPQASKRESR